MVKPSKPLLSPKNVKARLAWAKAHKDWTIDDWKRVIWSDETKINRFGSDGCHYTYKRIGERLQPKHVKQTVKHGGSSIMIWGCITYDGPGYVTKIDNTMDKVLYQKILEEDLALTMDWYDLNPRKVIFQHDNDPKHTAKTVVEYLDHQPYEVMDGLHSPQTSILLKTYGQWSNSSFSGSMKPLLRVFMTFGIGYKKYGIA
jgi:hypothetical protein